MIMAVAVLIASYRSLLPNGGSEIGVDEDENKNNN